MESIGIGIVKVTGLDVLLAEGQGVGMRQTTVTTEVNLTLFSARPRGQTSTPVSQELNGDFKHVLAYTFFLFFFCRERKESNMLISINERKNGCNSVSE